MTEGASKSKRAAGASRMGHDPFAAIIQEGMADASQAQALALDGAGTEDPKGKAHAEQAAEQRADPATSQEASPDPDAADTAVADIPDASTTEHTASASDLGPLEENPVTEQGQEQPSAGDNDEAIVLDSVMGIAELAQWHERLRSALAQPQAIVLDASGVDAVDTAAIQLLLAFVHEAQAKGAALTWRSPSDALCETAELLGVADHLNLDLM